MNQLIKYFNENYGEEYGKISYPRTTMQIYRVYQAIKSYGINDDKLVELLHNVKLPNPKSVEEKELYVDCLYNKDDNEFDRDIKDAPKKTIVEDNKLYLVKSDGTKIDEGTELPSIDVSKEYIDASLENKVDKVTGKGLSTVDFTKSYETKLKGLENYNDTTIKKDIQTINSQFKDIANLSLVKHTDGKVYIKKQDGTLIGTGIEIGGSDVDLSKITMSISGQTLKLMNNGVQITSVEIPTATITNEQINNAVNDYITNNGITFNFALKDADYNAYITTQKIVTNSPVIKGYTDYKTIAKGETIEFSGTLGSSNSLVLIPIKPITTNTTDKLYFDNDYYLRPYIYNNSKIISVIQTNYSLGTNSVDGTKVNAYCFDTKARFYCNNTVVSANYSTNYLKTNSYSITYFRNTTSTDYVAISYNKELTDNEFLQLAEQFGGEN